MESITSRDYFKLFEDGNDLPDIVDFQLTGVRGRLGLGPGGIFERTWLDLSNNCCVAKGGKGGQKLSLHENLHFLVELESLHLELECNSRFSCFNVLTKLSRDEAHKILQLQECR